MSTSQSEFPVTDGAVKAVPGTVPMLIGDDGLAQVITSANPLPVALVAGGADEPDPLLAPSSLLNITVATVVKALPGRLFKVSVVVAGAAVGTVNDCATTGAVSASNQVGTTPVLLGTTTFDWPCAVGIVIVPGTGQTLAVSFE